MTVINRHVWEGWHVNDFIEAIEQVGIPATIKTRAELKEYLKSEQPYYKRHIPEVFQHFVKKLNLK